MTNLIRLSHITKNYTDGEYHIPVLKDLCLDVAPGQIVFIMGSSGSGKSTLLHILSGFDTSYQGDFFYDDCAMKTMSKQRYQQWFLAHQVGIIFQNFYLFNDWTVEENLKFPLLMLALSPQEIEARIHDILKEFDLENKLLQPVRNLSGGEVQRIAVARALIKKPRLLLCDEPTGNLDFKNSQVVFQKLCSKAEELGSTVIIVTHSKDFFHFSDCILHLQDGQLVQQ